MKTLSIAIAVIRERTRRFSFWAMLGLSLAAAFLLVPSPEVSNFNVLVLEPDLYIQAGNVTWIPIASALCLTVFLPLCGFAYIKGMIALDRQTGAMDMFLAGGLGKFRYVFGKLLGGFVLLFSLLIVAVGGSFFTTLIQYPGEQMGFWTFISPFIALIPGLLFVSALSLLMETASVFRSGKLNGFVMTIYVIFYFFSLIMGLAASLTGLEGNGFSLDFTGMGLICVALNRASMAATGKPVEMITVMGSSYEGNGSTQLYFEGLTNSSTTWMSMLFVIAVSLLITFIAALILEKRPVQVKAKKEKIRKRRIKTIFTGEAWKPVESGNYSMVSMVRAELNRLTEKLGFWWLAAAVALWAVAWGAEYGTALYIVFPLIFGWMILPLSSLGSEEYITGMDELLLTVPGAPLRQSVASGLAGILISFIFTLPILIRSAGQSGMVFIMVLSWVFMIPLVGLVLGCYTKTERAYQIILIVFLYAAMNVSDSLLPVTGGAVAAISAVYLVIAAVSLAAVIFKKKSYR